MADEYLNPGLPIGEASLARIEAIAQLRGLAAADVTRASVLEIGCGNGARTLMMAECYPGSRFLGVDGSAASIARANETAATLGLANVNFRQQSLDDAATLFDAYDYIICQGQYSRVPPVQSEQILRICQRHLKPDGVALIGYDAYPGQHSRDLLRRMMQYEGRASTTAQELVSRARLLVGFLQRGLTDKNRNYDALVASELERLKTCDDSQLWHDYLAPHLRPRYLGQFLRELQTHGLKYCGDCEIGVRYADELKPEVEQGLQLVASEEVARDGFRDLVKGRARRLTLVCHADRALQKELQTDTRGRLWLKSTIAPENAETSISAALVQFVTATGQRISTKAPLIQAALLHLGSLWPQTIKLDALLLAAKDRLAVKTDGAIVATEADLQRLTDNMLQCAAAHIIDVQSQPEACSYVASDRPLASPLARWQAERGPQVVNRDHATVHLEPLDQHLLPLLDGTRDASQQVNGLIAAVRSGRLSATDQGQPIEDANFLRGTLTQAQAQSLANLARQALLIA